MTVCITTEMPRFFDIDNNELVNFIVNNHLDIEEDIEKIANEFNIPTDTIKARH